MKQYDFPRRSIVVLQGTLLALLLGACAPDLIVKNVHHEPFLTTALKMKGTVENQGNKTAGESKTSLESRSDSNTPFHLEAKVATPSLRPGESKELDLWIFSPHLLPPGSSCLQVRVCADADNTINESSEINNCVTKSYPDICPSCIHFEDQTMPTTFNVGDAVLTSGIRIRVEQFQWGNGTWSSSGHAMIDNRQNARGSGKDINTNNVNLHFMHSYPVHKIEFKFGELGGNNNISINGTFQNVADLKNLNGTSIGGAQVKVVAVLQGANWYGNITIEGNITDFSIGGQELWIDDYCYTP